MLRSTRGYACLYLSLCLGIFLLFCLVHQGRRVPLGAPPQGCVKHREIRYCVTAWDRDWWNVNSRAAIGAAAEAWNRVGPYQFREVYCNDPHDLPIFFERGAHTDGHALGGWPHNVLAHATFPNDPTHFIHIRDDLAWQQAQDTLHRGHDMGAVALHEMGHHLGLTHDEGDSVMHRIVVPWGGPYENDIDRVRSYAKSCEIDPPPAIEITAPLPGTTWHHGETYTIAWSAPSLEGHVVVDVRYRGRNWWRVSETAPVSSEIEIEVNGNWPLGCPYEVCIWHPDTGQICSSMILVAPGT